MNGNSGAMSPVSVDGSDWSGINQYQKSDPPFSPTFSSRGNLATPPTSGIPSAPLSPSGTALSLPGSANPSPPSSVGGARSSVGTIDDSRDGGRRRRQMEEILHQHYVTLKRFLSATYREDRINGRSNKARDKLLRLSPTQFHELSTDVYDELVRRQQATPAPGRPPRPDAPTFLPPRDDFHEKRNHARQKLAMLQHQRFRDLATDVFCELERRFPQFTGRRPSPNMPPGARASQQSRGPSRAGRGYPSGGPPGSPFPPRQGSLGGPPPGMNGDGPFPRSFQSNTMVPNKSTMVEDSDDMGAEDDDDARSDAFALDAVLSRRGTTMTLSDTERKMLLDSQAQVSSLQEKVEKLEEMVRAKDEELSRSQDSDQSAVSLSILFYFFLSFSSCHGHFIRSRLTSPRSAIVKNRSGMFFDKTWRPRYPRPRTSITHYNSSWIASGRNMRPWNGIYAISLILPGTQQRTPEMQHWWLDLLIWRSSIRVYRKNCSSSNQSPLKSGVKRPNFSWR